MSVTEFSKIEGAGRGLDRTLELCEAIKEVCYRIGNEMPVAAVIGCIEIAKIEIISEQQE